MNTRSNLFQLLSWMSPSYPVGAFTFSQGIENAVEIGLITNADQSREWIYNLLLYGNGHADLVFLKAAWEAAKNRDALHKVSEFALAYQGSLETRLEASAQGNAFFNITSNAWPCDTFQNLPDDTTASYTYPVVVGVAARGHEIDKEEMLFAYGHAYVANLVSAAVRLVPLGQTDGQLIIAAMKKPLEESVERALCTPFTCVANSTFMADITSMQHETQYTRLFRS